MDLVATETSYVTALTNVVHKLGGRLQAQNVLTSDEMEDIFGNLADLIPPHERFLEELNELQSNWKPETSLVGYRGDFILFLIRQSCISTINAIVRFVWRLYCEV